MLKLYLAPLIIASSFLSLVGSEHQTANCFTLQTRLPITCMALNKSGSRLAVGLEKSQNGVMHYIQIWDITKKNQKCLQQFVGHTDPITCLAFNPNDDDQLVSGAYNLKSGDNGTVKLWNMSTNNVGRNLVVPRRITGAPFSPTSIVFHPNSKSSLVAVGSLNQNIYVWDLNIKTKSDPQRLQPKNSSCVLAFSADGVHIASGSSIGDITLWSTTTDPYAWKEESDGEINALTFNQKGTILASGSTDRTITLWSLESFPPQPIKKLSYAYPAVLKQLIFSHEDSILTAVYKDGTRQTWNAKFESRTYNIEDKLSSHALGETIRVRNGDTETIAACYDMVKNRRIRILRITDNQTTPKPNSSKKITLFLGACATVFALYKLYTWWKNR